MEETCTTPIQISVHKKHWWNQKFGTSFERSLRHGQIGNNREQKLRFLQRGRFEKMLQMQRRLVLWKARIAFLIFTRNCCWINSRFINFVAKKSLFWLEQNFFDSRCFDAHSHWHFKNFISPSSSFFVFINNWSALRYKIEKNFNFISKFFSYPSTENVRWRTG